MNSRQIWLGVGLLLTNSIIAHNTGSNPWSIQQNCTVSLTDGGGNLQYPQRTTNLWNDYECLAGQTAVDPLLGLLSDNGGPTLSIPLLPGSPAINGGVNAPCPTTDQRGYLRVDGQCDAGAYEVDAMIFTPTHRAYLPLAMRGAGVSGQ